jgi:hypothetical protein
MRVRIAIRLSPRPSIQEAVSCDICFHTPPTTAPSSSISMYQRPGFAAASKNCGRPSKARKTFSLLQSLLFNLLSRSLLAFCSAAITLALKATFFLIGVVGRELFRAGSGGDAGIARLGDINSIYSYVRWREIDISEDSRMRNALLPHQFWWGAEQEISECQEMQSFYAKLIGISWRSNSRSALTY